MSQFEKDPRQIRYLEIDSLKDDTKRLGMRPSYGQTDLFSEGQSVPAPGAGTSGRISITGGRSGGFVDEKNNTMTNYYFDHLFLTWRKTVYHFPPGTVFGRTAGITYNAQSNWRTLYKSFHRYPVNQITIITIE